jgi:hypothetical protein
MANISTETTLGPAEREFMDMMQHGDDFFKIELLRHARSCYKKALELNMEPEKVKQKIAECNKLLKMEQKVILILVAIALLMTLVYFVLRS